MPLLVPFMLLSGLIQMSPGGETQALAFDL